MSRNRELRDLAIRIAISGSDDLEDPGVQIVDDYLNREVNENLREQGYPVETEVFERTEFEKAVWKCDKQVEALHLERWQKTQDEKNAHLEREYDDDRMDIVLSKRIVKV